MKVRFNQKAILTFVLVFLSMVTFLGCQTTENTTDHSSNTTNTTNTTNTSNTSNTSNTTEEFIEIPVSTIYDNLVEYKDRINHILIGHVIEEETEEAIEMSMKLLTAEQLPEGAVKYTREALLESFLLCNPDRDYELYYGELDHTGDFITSIIDFIDENEGIVLDQLFYPNPSDDKTYYKFISCSDESIIIQKNADTENLYMKIGFNESDSLKFQQINYSYDSNSDLSKVEACIRFNYFEFEEGVECLYMNSLGNRGSVNYTSLVDELVISVSYDENIIEGFETGGYIVSRYDKANDHEYILSVSNDEILSESYCVYNDHGYLYTYSQYDLDVDEILIRTNFIEATGWDYLIGADFYTSDEIEEVSGIYKNDGTVLYQGNIPYSISENYTTAQINRVVTSETLTDAEMNLSNYGMLIDDEKASLEYLNSIKVTDFNKIKQSLIVKDINIFNDNKSLELYDYLDDDIKTIIEGKDVEPIQSTGDVEAFSNALNLNANEQMTYGKVIAESIHTTSTEVNGEISSSKWLSGNQIDLEELYYYSYMFGLDGVPSREICTETNGKLVLFSTIGGFDMSYEIISNNATVETFETYLSSLSAGSSNILDHIISVEQVSTYTFNLVLNQSFYGLVKVTDDLYRQQGIGGFSESTIEAVMTFDEDYKGYGFDLTLSGLYLLESTDIAITNKTLTNVTITDFDIADPLTLATYLELPSTKSEILFDFELEESYGVSYRRNTSYWIRMELEPGYYKLYRDDLYTVYDDQNNEIEIGRYLRIETSGTYYFELNTDRTDSSYFVLSQVPDRTSYNFDLDSQSGYIEMVIEEGANDYFLNVASAPTDRLVKIILPDNSNVQDYLFFSCQKYSNGATYGKDYMGQAMNIYFIIPANESLEIVVGGYYFGEISFDYELINLPTPSVEPPSQNMLDINDFPDVVLTPEVNESRVEFTLTESGEYRIDFDYYNFGCAQVIVNLYKSDGSIVSGDCERRKIDLEAGDYYYVFSFDEDYEVNSLVIISTLTFKSK